MKPKQTKVFVDSDTLLFSAAAVAEQRSIEVTHDSTGITKAFKTRTEFKDLMKSKGKSTEGYSIQDVQTEEPVENCLQIVKGTANKILTNFDFCDVTFIAGDFNNFRLELPLPSKYKGSREGTLRPVHLKAAHSYFQQQYKSVRAMNKEADDEIAVLAYKALMEGYDAVILSPDKDARQFDGIKIGDYDSAPDTLVLVKETHEVKLSEDKKVKTYGIPWLAYQWLVGDPSDCYKPTELAKVKYGDVSAYKELVNLNTPKEILELVVSKYKQWYPDKFEYTDWNGQQHEADYITMLDLYYRCARMMRSKDDSLDFRLLLDKYGVSV